MYFLIFLSWFDLKKAKKSKQNGIQCVVLAPSRELAEQIGAVGRALAEGSWIKVSDTQQNDKSIIASTIFERDWKILKTPSSNFYFKLVFISKIKAKIEKNNINGMRELTQSGG